MAQNTLSLCADHFFKEQNHRTYDCVGASYDLDLITGMKLDIKIIDHNCTGKDHSQLEARSTD